jgi:hypothetical protein
MPSARAEGRQQGPIRRRSNVEVWGASAARIYHDSGPLDTSGVRARSADKKVVQPMLLLATLMLSVGLSLAISRIFLGSVFHVMAHGGLPTFHWRPVIFVTALFWIWYLTPAIAASHAATRVFQLLLH